MLKLKLQFFSHLIRRTNSSEKTLMLGKIEGRRRRKCKDEMVGGHHQLDGHEFEQASGVGDGQGSLACYSPWGRQESDMTEWLNWTEVCFFCCFPSNFDPQMLFICQGSPAIQHWVFAAVCPLLAACRCLCGSRWPPGAPASVYESDQCVGQVLLSWGGCSGHGTHPGLTRLSAEPGFLCRVTPLGRCSSDKTLVMSVVKNLGSWVRTDVSGPPFPSL